VWGIQTGCLENESKEGIRMRKILKIKDKNSFVYYKNRKLRTPVNIEVEIKELKSLVQYLRMTGIQEYTIVPVPLHKKMLEKEILFDIDVEEDKEVVIEELEEPTTILGKLMKNGDLDR